MTLLNIIDHRKRPYRFLRINAVIEPTRHDNRVKDADQAPGRSDSWLEYEETEHVPLNEAFAWAEAHPDEVTLYLYDEDGGIYGTQERASGHQAP